MEEHGARCVPRIPDLRCFVCGALLNPLPVHMMGCGEMAKHGIQVDATHNIWVCKEGDCHERYEQEFAPLS